MKPQVIEKCRAGNVTLALTPTEIVITPKGLTEPTYVPLMDISALGAGTTPRNHHNYLITAASAAVIAMGAWSIEERWFLGEVLTYVALLAVMFICLIGVSNRPAVVIAVRGKPFDCQATLWQGRKLRQFASAVNRQRVLLEKEQPDQPPDPNPSMN